MRRKSLFDRLPLYLLWALFSVLFTGWLFMLITDTRRENKLTLMIDAVSVSEEELVTELEKDLPEAIRMVKVRLFSYAMFSENSLKEADIWIVKESDIGSYREAFAAESICPPEHRDWIVTDADGKRFCGVKVYDGSLHRGAAGSFVRYFDAGQEEEDCYLFFNADSLHTGQNGRDREAFALAEKLLGLP